MQRGGRGAQQVGYKRTGNRAVSDLVEIVNHQEGWRGERVLQITEQRPGDQGPIALQIGSRVQDAPRLLAHVRHVTLEGAHEVGQQHRGGAVIGIKAEPSHSGPGALQINNPLGEQGGFAVTCRGDDEGSRAQTHLSEERLEIRPQERLATGCGCGQLQGQQSEAGGGRLLRRGRRCHGSFSLHINWRRGRRNARRCCGHYRRHRSFCGPPVRRWASRA